MFCSCNHPDWMDALAPYPPACDLHNLPSRQEASEEREEEESYTLLRLNERQSTGLPRRVSSPAQWKE